MALILVVEDDEANLELVTRFLRRRGHVVLQAVDGAAGVAAAQVHIPDLIVMDLGLPKMDGWEAARQIRVGRKTARVRLVALTARTFPEDVRKAQAAGFDAYETKPVAYQRLMQKIEALLAC
jgi:CheY-like chemotaxis protein